ncbi:MAG: hypothetical protein CMA88_00755 [Euryarchaeota archaeon]|nr:hypothetical protein [Euryarchaeota archaeon]|tara:strand:+ start:51 stop:1709 length:1659 start_codon:yes stop_codon:yes gene_type:complete
MGLMTTMLVFWIGMLVVFVMLNRGLWVFTDVTKSMSMFMLEKALGPPIDFVEGRKGSAAAIWIIHGALWMIPSSALTFCGLWLSHDPNALHSLSSWGLNLSSSPLILAGILTASYGAGGMLLNGTAMHIVPELGGTTLASEKNASLMSFVWTLGVLVLLVGANKPEILGIKIMLVSTGILMLSGIAVIVNMLLTAATRTRKMALPAWMMIMGMIAAPLSALAVALSGALDTGTGQWLATRMSAASFSLMIAGAVLYAASRGSGNPLWSRSLAAVTLVGTILSISSSGFFEGGIAADFLGVDQATFEPTRNEVIAGSFLLALSLIPVIALSANVLATMRGDDVFMENPDSPGMPEINLAAMMLIPLSIGALFVHTDHLTGTNELTGVQSTLVLMGIWLVFVPGALGSALCIFPEVSGRNVLSMNRSRWAYWLMAGGSFGLVFSMMSDFSHMTLVEAAVEDEVSTANRLQVLGSVLFYGTVIGSIYHCLNIISGSFRGTLVDTESSVSSTSILSPYRLTKETTVRKILAQREGKLDTVVVPESSSDSPGTPTEL